MSSASPFGRSVPDVSPLAGAQWVESLAVSAARFTGFWSAVVSPFALLAMVLSGVATQQTTLFAVLLAVNVAGLALGRKYNRD